MTDAPRTDGWSSGEAYEGYIGRWSRLVAAEFLDWLDLPGGLDWLDVGCGTGVLSRAILDRRGPRSMIGLDPSAAFVDHARRAVADGRARFLVAGADDTGVSDASVDVVVSGLVLNFVPDLGAALREAQRITRPGGSVAAYVWDYADGMHLLRRFFDVAIELDPTMREHDEGVRFPITHEGRLASVFEAAGLLEVEQRPIDVPTVFRDFDDLWNPFLRGTGPAPGYVASLADAERARLRDRLRETLVEAPDGSIHLTARAWAVRGRVG